jgi:predicted nucleic acid-binding protein
LQDNYLVKMAQKAIVFDSGPIINLAINNMLWILEELRNSCNAQFYITPAVYDELINKPLNTRKYKLEALQVLPHITNGTLKLYKHPAIKRIAEELNHYANNAFQIRNQWIKIVHAGEIEALATAIFLQADAIGIDERTMRHLIEKPEKIAEHMEHRIHTDVTINWKNLNAIKKKVRNMRVIRSAELVTIAFEKGILSRYTKTKSNNIPNMKRAVLEGALWAVKLNGCSMKEQEIKQILKMEKQ